jgi:hypothetical protein
MLLHIDGSRHRWLQDERWCDLIVILDDATSAVFRVSRFLPVAYRRAALA